jgi:hypothetical protein
MAREYTPTRRCPHRLCVPLHIGFILPTIIFVVLLFMHGTGGQSLGQASFLWGFLILVGVVCYAIARIVHGRSDKELDRLERRDKARPRGRRTMDAVCNTCCGLGRLSRCLPSPGTQGPA